MCDWNGIPGAIKILAMAHIRCGWPGPDSLQRFNDL